MAREETEEDPDSLLKATEYRLDRVFSPSASRYLIPDFIQGSSYQQEVGNILLLWAEFACRYLSLGMARQEKKKEEGF